MSKATDGRLVRIEISLSPVCVTLLQMSDPRLISAINSGHAFSLIGSGPSTDMGYPSWKKLATELMDDLKKRSVAIDDDTYQKFLSDRKYPELFRQAEIDLGSRAALVAFLKQLLKGDGRPAHIYDLLGDWPFACYLTTNYDDEISAALLRKRVFFKTIRNTKLEFASIRHAASHMIAKIHSDLEHQETAVITSADYTRFKTDPEMQYFREKLRSIFQMFDVCIVGHSLSDPDLQLILEAAKDAGSPTHPIFYIGADLTEGERREFLERYNIVCISYKNPDGTHSQLRRLLGVMNRFITPRTKRVDVQEATAVSDDEIEAAQSLVIYRRMRSLSAETHIESIEYLSPLILQTLQRISAPASLAEMLKAPPLAVAATSEEIRTEVRAAVPKMLESGLLEQLGDAYKLSGSGSDKTESLGVQKKLLEEQALGQFVTDVRNSVPSLDAAGERDLIGMFRGTLVNVFKRRGFSIANAVIGGQSVTQTELTDIFKSISLIASAIKNSDLSLAFVEASHKFLLEPSSPQKDYLASISQGYFLYHLLGLDPKCAKVRTDILQGTVWWCDASVLLPLVAVGCHNHEYAKDLFGRLRSVKARTYTTNRFLKEVTQHLQFAVRHFEEGKEDASQLLAAALLMGSYKQNLFLDGYIRLAAEGKVGTFRDYLDLAFPRGTKADDIASYFQEKGFPVANVGEIKGYDTSHVVEIAELESQITDQRIKEDNLRSQLQIEAEAEVLHIIRSLGSGRYMLDTNGESVERTFFLSQSRLLDRIPPRTRVSWTPEALYRYLISLPGSELDPDLLQQCMLQEYYSLGIKLIDRPRYNKFFGATIDAAKIKFAEEKERFIKETQKASAEELEKAFTNTPDLEKPFFVGQMGWQIAQSATLRAEAAKQRAIEAELQVKVLSAERDAAWKKSKKAREKQEAAAARNLRDPKHLRKRARQAKKRNRKKS